MIVGVFVWVVTCLMLIGRFVVGFKSLSTKVSAQLQLSTSLDFSILPELVVFDLDACLWLPEMYTLREIPTTDDRIFGKLGESNGCVGLRSSGEVIRLFPDAVEILQSIYQGKYTGLRCAVASSADTPRATAVAKASLSLLEIMPGITMKDVFSNGWDSTFEGNIQIGRQSPLSSNKATSHFPIIREATKIPYDKMIYFDDCLWDDHCTNVAKQCPGVVTQRTPSGLRKRDWENCLKSYAQRYSTQS